MKFSFKSIFSINPASLTFCSILLVVFLFLIGLPILDLMELKTFDLRFRSRGYLKPAPAVVLALVDEKSLDKEGRWPWPRSKIANLVNVLSGYGAKVIAFDIGFLEPDENSQLELIGQFDQQVNALEIRNTKLAEFIKERRKTADNDLALAQAIKSSSATVVLGYFFHMSEHALNYRIEQSEIDQLLKRIDPSYPLVIYEDRETRVDPFIEAYAPESNLEVFTKAAQSSGYYNVTTDPDGVVRWLPLAIKCGENIYPPLSLLSVWHLLNRPQLMVKVAMYGVEGIRLGERFIPTDEKGQMLINYLGPAKTFPHISISDILSGEVGKEAFKDKVVLVGATAMGTHDIRSTPIGPLYPGVEVHATVIDNILTQNFLSKPKWSKIYDLMAIILLGLVTGLVLPRLSALKGLVFVTMLFIFQVIIARWLFVHSGVWLNIVYPLLTLSVAYTTLTLYHYVTEERERKKIKGAFKHYVAPNVIEQMLENPELLQLGGEEKVLTVLFSDLAGFTGYSERFRPPEMIKILSDYFAEMTEQIFAYEGTLKEYVGDELMAIFGAPLDQHDHAERACAAALAMRDRRQELAKTWAEMGRPQLKARTGVNSGSMLVGNLGSRYRFAYGALGDHVNLGSRLEGLNKMYSTEILIGENTARLVGEKFRLREIDLARVKGRVTPERIHELLANSSVVLAKEREQALSCYAAGFEAYLQQQWQEALGIFQEALELWPEDGPSRVMAQRCRIYQETPPPEDWDGVFEHVSK